MKNDSSSVSRNPAPAPSKSRLDDAPFDTLLRLATLNLMEDAAEERRRGEKEAAERQRAERSLQRSEERLEAALAVARMACWDWNPKTDRLVATDNAVELFGLWPGASLTSAAFAFSLIHPHDAPRRQSLVEIAAKKGTNWHTEYRLIRPRDGKIVWLEERAMVSRDAQSGEAHLTGLVWDVTERKATEVALQNAFAEAERARGEAEAAIRTKDRFLAVVSHELRTPLTPVSLSAEMLLQRDDLPPRVREDLERIRRNVDLETRLIGDLLDLSRISCGKFEMSLESLDLHETVRRAAQVAEPDFRARSQHLEIDLAARRSRVTGDPTRLQQVFWNLLKNASKFTPENGQIAVRSEVRDGSLRVEVRDNGAGIPPEMLACVFEPFRQVKSSAHPGHDGLGLGLAIALATVEAHDGSIVAESAGEGKGSVFRVTLPLEP